LAETDEKLFGMGYRRTAESMIEIYGDGFEPIEANPPAQIRATPLVRGASGSSTFAESSNPIATARQKNTQDQIAIMNAAETLAGDYKTLYGDRVDGLLAMLDETGDLNLFSQKLTELLKTSPPPALVTAVANAGFNAALLGATNGQR